MAPAPNKIKRRVSVATTRMPDHDLVAVPFVERYFTTGSASIVAPIVTLPMVSVETVRSAAEVPLSTRDFGFGRDNIPSGCRESPHCIRDGGDKRQFSHLRRTRLPHARIQRRPSRHVPSYRAGWQAKPRPLGDPEKGRGLREARQPDRSHAGIQRRPRRRCSWARIWHRSCLENEVRRALPPWGGPPPLRSPMKVGGFLI